MVVPLLDLELAGEIADKALISSRTSFVNRSILITVKAAEINDRKNKHCDYENNLDRRISKIVKIQSSAALIMMMVCGIPVEEDRPPRLTV